MDSFETENEFKAEDREMHCSVRNIKSVYSLELHYLVDGHIIVHPHASAHVGGLESAVYGGAAVMKAVAIVAMVSTTTVCIGDLYLAL